MDVYYVVDWHKHYAKSQARTDSGLAWVAQSVNLNHDKYLSIIERPIGCALYGIFRIILSVAARCVPDGILVDRHGRPFNTESLATKTHIPKRQLVRAIPILVNEEKLMAAAPSVEAAAAAVLASRPAWNNGDGPPNLAPNRPPSLSGGQAPSRLRAPDRTGPDGRLDGRSENTSPPPSDLDLGEERTVGRSEAAGNELFALAQERGIQVADEVAASGLPVNVVRELCDAADACRMHAGWVVTEIRRMRDKGGGPRWPSEWRKVKAEREKLAAADKRVREQRERDAREAVS